MSTAAKRLLTEQEYLRRERAAEFKSEFYRGELFAMAGASREHNLVAGGLFTELNRALRDTRCEAYMNDMRVKVSATGLYTYPDIAIACGQPQFDDDQRDTLLNPVVLVEVLSQSTETYDRGVKWAQYRRLPSLQEFVLVSQSAPQIEVYRRQADGDWLLTDVSGLNAVLELKAVGARIPLTEIYQQVEFPPSGSGSAE